MDSTKPKKAVRFAKVNEPAVNLVTSSAVDLTPLVTRLEAMQSSLDQMKAEKQSARPVSSSTQQPAQRRLMPPPQSPSQQSRQQQPQSTRFGGSSQRRGAALVNDRHSATNRRRKVDSSVKLRHLHRLNSQHPGLLVLTPGFVAGHAEVAMFVDDMVVTR